MIRSKTFEPRLLILLSAGLGMIGYMYLTPPANSSALLAELLGTQRMAVETAVYVQRFAVAFAFLGVLPVGVARGCGYRLRDLGWRRLEGRSSARWLPLTALAGILIGALSTLSPDVAAYYPYSPSLAARTAEQGVGPFMIHATSYLLFYYVPWETLFRGVLIFTLIDEMVSDRQPESRIILIASLQAIPSALLHFGHPASETVFALFFGIAAGIVAVRTRSIFPALVFHAAVGLGLDGAIVFLARG